MNLKAFIEMYGDQFPYPVTVANQDQTDEPLVYVNKFFRDFTGYEDEEILGKNCRFLQRDRSHPDSIRRIREAINARLPICQDLINFKKNGELFYNRLVLIPFRIQATKYFLGLQHEIPMKKYQPIHDIPASELRDRMINPLSVMLSLELVADARLNEEFQSMIKKIQSFVLSL